MPDTISLLPVGVGLIGSQFVTSIHAEALRACAQAELRAVASPTPGNAEAFAKRHGIARHFTDYRELLQLQDVDMVVVGVPNDLHCAITLAAAAAGKHVVMEKPLCLNLAEADQMIAACRKAKVKLMYAEELCFAPKYVRLKALLDEGALGRPILLKQSEKHGGPHAAHFLDVARSGGGVTMDMGCHAVQFFRWMLDRAPIKSVYAQMSTLVHAGRTRGDDNAILLLGCRWHDRPGRREPDRLGQMIAPKCTDRRASPTPICCGWQCHQRAAAPALRSREVGSTGLGFPCMRRRGTTVFTVRWLLHRPRAKRPRAAAQQKTAGRYWK